MNIQVVHTCMCEIMKHRQALTNDPLQMFIPFIGTSSQQEHQHIKIAFEDYSIAKSGATALIKSERRKWLTEIPSCT